MKESVPRFIGASAAARILGVSSVTVGRMVERGELSCTDSTIGRLFDEAVVRALAAERAREPRATNGG